jgi:hypothetical protein
MIIDVIVLLWILVFAGVALGVGRFVKSTLQARSRLAGDAPSANRMSAPPSATELASLRQRVEILEARIDERDQSIRKLQDELSFVSRMLEDKTDGTGTQKGSGA